MKDSVTEKFGHLLKSLTNEQIDKLLSTLLREMRRRDVDQLKRDVVTHSKSLRQTRPIN
jgi:hypothetical protein